MRQTTTKLLTAEEARKIVRQHPDREEINQINDAIRVACGEGKSSCYLDGSISQFAKKDLEANGFEVKYEQQYNESYTIIKWG